jgi:hypothetical protein
VIFVHIMEGTLLVFWCIGFCCKKSGSFTKSVKNFTIRKVNHSNHLEKWYIKVSITALKCKKKIFATQSFVTTPELNENR